MPETQRQKIGRNLFSVSLFFAIIFLPQNVVSDSHSINPAAVGSLPEEDWEADKECIQPEIKKAERIAFTGEPGEILADAFLHETDFFIQQGLLNEAATDFENKFLKKLISGERKAICRHYHESLGSLSYLFGRLPRYSEMIVAAAKEHGVPYAIAIGVVIIESNANPRAVNTDTHAAGLMQLTASTAMKFGLKVSRRKDERFDPELNIGAGMRILRYLHDRYGRWDLTLLAYAKGTPVFDAQLFRNFRIAGINPEQISKAKITFADMRSENITGLNYPARVEALARLWIWYEKELQKKQLEKALAVRSEGR